jgi:hypothetical protein
MKTRHIIAFAILVGGCFAGSGAVAWDQDPFAMYFHRTDTITLGAGNAKAVNSATHIIDPWPRYVGNRRIPGNGDRLSRAVERYRQGSYRQPAPPIAPYVGGGGGGLGGGGAGGGGAGGGLGGGGAGGGLGGGGTGGGGAAAGGGGSASQ